MQRCQELTFRFDQAVVVSLPSIESAFVTHTAKGIKGWTHRDYAPMRVACEVLNQTESFLWVRMPFRGIRCFCSLSSSGTSEVRVLRTARTLEWTLKLVTSHSPCIAPAMHSPPQRKARLS